MIWLYVAWAICWCGAFICGWSRIRDLTRRKSKQDEQAERWRLAQDQVNRRKPVEPVWSLPSSWVQEADIAAANEAAINLQLAGDPDCWQPLIQAIDWNSMTVRERQHAFASGQFHDLMHNVDPLLISTLAKQLAESPIAQVCHTPAIGCTKYIKMGRCDCRTCILDREIERGDC